MIYLMRHGLDDERYVGGYSNIGLISTGIKQVSDSISTIRKLSINEIVCSDVLRARQTSEIISKETNLSVTIDSKLRELDKGLLNGMEKVSAKKLYPEYFEYLTIYDRYPNGECMLDLYNRIKLLLEEIDKYNNKLLVTHRGVINMIYYLLNDIELDMNKERFDVTHASIHELDVDKKMIRRIY